MKPGPKPKYVIRSRKCVGCGIRFNYRFYPDKPRQQYCTQKCSARTIGRKIPEGVDLYAMYWEQSLSCAQIAKTLNVKPCSVFDRLVKLGIPRRRRSRRSPTRCLVEGCISEPFAGPRCEVHDKIYQQQRRTSYWFRVWRWRKRGIGSQEDVAGIIDRAVPKNVPPEIREEVCQELAVKLMLNEITVDELTAAAEASIKRLFSAQFRMLSLDAPVGDGLTLGDLVREDGKVIRV